MNLGSYIQDTLINRLEKTLKHNMTRFHLVEWQTCERDFYKLLSIAMLLLILIHLVVVILHFPLFLWVFQ